MAANNNNNNNNSNKYELLGKEWMNKSLNIFYLIKKIIDIKDN